MKKRRKQTEEKYWKVKRKENEEYEGSQITTIYVLGFKLFFARKHNLRNFFIPSSLIYSFYELQDIFKQSNDKPKVNIHKYTNYNIIEIYINRLSITAQIFIATDYLIMMSEKYLYFKIEKTFGKEIFFNPISKKNKKNSQNS